MPYCPNCGREVPSGTVFCPHCGAALRETAREPLGSETAFGRLASDWRLQRHWLERLVAYVIDSALVGVFTTILYLAMSFPLFITDFWGWWSSLFRLPSFLGIVYLLYFTLMEGGYGYTFGKRLLGLEVVTVDNRPPTLVKAFVRNLSKVFWPFLFIDMVLGLLSRGDPRQRFMDQLAGTTVAEMGERRGWNFFSPLNSSFHTSSAIPPPREEIMPRRGRVSVDLANLGAFIVIGAAVFLIYPTLSSNIVQYLESWGRAGHPILPPRLFLGPLFYFIALTGVWHLILAGTLAAAGYRRRSVSDATWGGFLLATGYLIQQYDQRTLTFSSVTSFILIAFGALVIIRALAR
jgi:uncharacterized RDD family membrane protein YckC